MLTQLGAKALVISIFPPPPVFLVKYTPIFMYLKKCLHAQAAVLMKLSLAGLTKLSRLRYS